MVMSSDESLPWLRLETSPMGIRSQVIISWVEVLDTTCLSSLQSECLNTCYKFSVFILCTFQDLKLIKDNHQADCGFGNKLNSAFQALSEFDT